jgi:hypothetical protein
MSTMIYDLMHVISRKGTFFYEYTLDRILFINQSDVICFWPARYRTITTSLENVAKKEVGEEYRFYV